MFVKGLVTSCFRVGVGVVRACLGLRVGAVGREIAAQRFASLGKFEVLGFRGGCRWWLGFRPCRPGGGGQPA